MARARFGLDDKKRTLEEIGQTLGVSLDTIRKIERMALAKLRHPSRRKHLDGFAS